MMTPDYFWWHGFYEGKKRYNNFREKDSTCMKKNTCRVNILTFPLDLERVPRHGEENRFHFESTSLSLCLLPTAPERQGIKGPFRFSC